MSIENDLKRTADAMEKIATLMSVYLEPKINPDCGIQRSPLLENKPAPAPAPANVLTHESLTTKMVMKCMTLGDPTQTKSAALLTSFGITSVNELTPDKFENFNLAIEAMQ